MLWFKKKIKDHSETQSKEEVIQEEDGVSYSRQVVKEINYYKDISQIPDLYRALLLKNNEAKLEFIKELDKIVMKLNPIQYFNLDSIFRQESCLYHYIKGEVTIEDLNIKGLTEDENITILGLASFNANGWTREAALKELVRYSNNRIIPFILLRSADWIPSIRNTAVKKLNKLITVDNLGELLNYFPLIKRMEKISRFDDKFIYTLIDDIFKDNSVYEDLLEALNREEQEIREYALLKLLEYYYDNLPVIIGKILKEKSTSIRVKVVRRLFEKINSEDLLVYKDSFLKDKSPKIKSMTLNKLYEFGSFESVESLIPFTLDKNRTLREDGRYLIAKRIKYDFVSLYKNNLDLKGAVLGLCEVATKNEIELLKTLLYKGTNKEAQKILRTIANIDINCCENELLNALSNGTHRLSVEAKRIIIKNKGTFNCEEIYNIFVETKMDYVAINCINILCYLSKWDALPYILEFCASENKEYSSIGTMAFSNWKLIFNRSMTKPSLKQNDKIVRYIKKFGHALGDSTIEYLQFML